MINYVDIISQEKTLHLEKFMEFICEALYTKRKKVVHILSTKVKFDRIFLSEKYEGIHI